MSALAQGKAIGSVRRWRVASSFLAIVTFTVIAGYYIPLDREAKQLRSDLQTTQQEHAALRRDVDASQRELRRSQEQNKQLVGELDVQKSLLDQVKQRIEKLKEVLSAKFGPLSQAKMLTVSSAGDRVSIAIAIPVLFSPNGPEVKKDGRILLCKLSKAIMAEFSGQIRVTGYYGKPRIDEPALAERHASTWELSAARAARAVDVLEKDCGAPTDRFLVVGYGPRAAGPLGENVALEFILKADE
jgi:flagellar motor protein MotB